LREEAGKEARQNKKLLELVNGFSFIVNIVGIDNELLKDIIKNLTTDKYLKKVYNYLVKRVKKPLLETTNGVKIMLLNYYINK
jgi:hypothetical protein